MTSEWTRVAVMRPGYTRDRYPRCRTANGAERYRAWYAVTYARSIAESGRRSANDEPPAQVTAEP